MPGFSNFSVRFRRFSIPSFILLLCFLSYLGFQVPYAFGATNYWQFPGMVFRLWDMAEDYSQTCPNCGPIGGIKVVLWNRCDVGGGDGSSYTCGEIDDYIEATRNMKVTLPDGRQIPRPFILNIQIYSSDGEFTPNRVYQSGAKAITDCHGNRMPNYGDLIWREEYYKLARALANRYGNHPQIAAFIFGVGFDDEAYPIKYCEPADPTGAYGDFLWEFASRLGEYFIRAGKRPVYILAGGAGYTSDVVNAALKYGVGVKSATISGQWDLGKVRYVGERNASYESIVGNEALLDPGNEAPWSSAMRTTDQISWPFEDGKPFGIGDVMVAQQVYLQTMMMLSFHADWFNLRNITSKERRQGNMSAYPGDYATAANFNEKYTKEFVPTYLNKTRANTPGVWITFRRVSNPEICRDCQYPPPAGTNVVCWVENSRDRKVCETHVLGDLQYYLKKVADSGSTGKFAQRGNGVSDFPLPARNQIYGFGRELANGQYMGLRIEDRVWLRSITGDVQMRLILLNSGSDSVSVEFKKADGSTYVETITKGASLGTPNSFVEVERIISSVRFDGSLQGGSDIVIRASGGPSIIHLLEIKPTIAPPDHKPSPSTPAPTPPEPTPTPPPTDRTVVDDTASGWTWIGWPQYDDSNCHGGTARGGQTPGAYGQHTFRGTGVEYYAWKGPDGGQVDVILNGVSQGTYSLFNAEGEIYKAKIFEKKDLAPGSHTIRIVAKDAAWTMVDYLVIFGASTPIPAPSPTPEPPAVAGTYTIQASDGSWGTMTPTGSVVVRAGASQTFTMNPFPGFEVANVIVDGKSVGPVDSYTFSNVKANHTIHAEFRKEVPTTYALTITQSGPGSGTVTANPSRTSYDSGTVVTLSAVPAANSAFAGWSGACTGTSPFCSLTMNGDKTVTAYFEKVNAPGAMATSQKGSIIDLDRNGRDDVLWFDAGSRKVFAWYMRGRRCDVVDIHRDVAESNWKMAGGGNLARNGNYNIFWHNEVNGKVYAWFMNGVTYLGDQYIHTVEDTRWKMVGVGDFNGDGHADLLWHHQGTGALYIWFLNGVKFIRDQHVATIDDLRWQVVGVGDLNGDRKADILWQHSEGGPLYIWYMNGAKMLRDQHLGNVEDLNWKVIGIGKFSNPKEPNILWRHEVSGDIYIWYLRAGRFLGDARIQQ